MYNVGVVIPYYQRDSGILRKSLESISCQKVIDVFFTIVVVDDESPIPADNEIASVKLSDNCRVELIKQKNAGPAAARNKALDYLQNVKTDAVAFLDSDDVWYENHISEALNALETGAKFYFCDHSRFDKESSWFAHLNCFKNFENTLIDYDIKLSIDKKTAELTGYNCFKLFIKDYLSQTSCVVFDFNSFQAARFEPLLVSAGEDLFLWLNLVVLSNKVTFSFNKNVYCGEGVNIYFDSFDWGKLASSSQQGYNFILFKMISSNFVLQMEELDFVKRKIDFHVYRYSYLMVKHLITNIGFNKKLALTILKMYPLTMLLVPFRFVRAVMNKNLLLESNVRVDK